MSLNVHPTNAYLHIPTNIKDNNNSNNNNNNYRYYDYSYYF